VIFPAISVRFVCCNHNYHSLLFIVCSDLDNRVFFIPLVDVVTVLDGETVPVPLLSNSTQVGMAKRSVSGKAINFWIEPLLYTSPLVRVMDVLEGRARKAAVFVGV
jgi:hypothetical protein